jgi:hypothetical protein
LRISPDKLSKPSQPVLFTIQSVDDPTIVREAKSSFMR